MQYNHFSNFVLRTPLFPLSYLINLTKEGTIDEQELLKVSNSPVIKEALFIASPHFYYEFDKWLNNKITDIPKKRRIQESVLKYLSRMSSRCTPFGIFAGTVVGSIGSHSSILLNAYGDNNRHTRLDMNFLVAFAQNLAKESKIKKQLKFFPNSSLYQIGSHLRYVEYSYHNGKRVHHIVGVRQNEFVNKILTKAAEGAFIKELSATLIDNEINEDEANDFINQLIDAQLLVSTLEPSVTGLEFMEPILNTLSQLNGTASVVSKLEEIKKQLANLDNKLGNPITEYTNLTKRIESLGTDFDSKFLFQTDMTLSTENAILDKNVVKKVKQGLQYINKIYSHPIASLLTEFTKAFYARYETREIPLSEALDIESGIGFLPSPSGGDVSDIIDDLILPISAQKTNDLSISAGGRMLHKKLIQCIKNNDKIPILS